MTIRATDVTLTGTFTDNQGNPISGTLTFTLEGFGSTLPLIAGLQALPGLTFTTPVTAGVFSVSFYSNQIITPGPLVTFYTIAFAPSSTTTTVFAFAENFQFSPGTFDFSQLSPLQGQVPGRQSPTFVAPFVFTAIPNQFLTGLTPSGNFTSAQPTLSNLANLTLLNGQGSANAIVGTGSPAIFYTYTMPANTLVSGKAIRINVAWNHSTGTANVTYNFTLNGQNINSGGLISSSTGALKATIDLIATANSTASTSTLYNPSSAVANVPSVSGLSFSSSQVLSATFNVANTDQITPVLFLVELIQ